MEDYYRNSRQGRAVRIWVALGFLAGAVISVVLVTRHNFFSTIGEVRKVGWGFSSIIALYFAGIVLNGFAWRMLFRPGRPGPVKVLIAMRWVRESINYMVPTASFGGDVLGGRLLVMWGQDMSTTTGSIVVDKTLEAASLFFFAFAAAFILLEDGGSYKIAHWAVLALTAMSAMLAAFLLAQRMGFLNLLDKVLMLLCRRCGGGPGKIDIQNAVWKMYSNSGRLSAATVLHFLAWMPGVLQVWLSLRFMGYGVSWPGAFIIEGLCQAACAAAFILPAKLGAQEAAYMTVGTFFGIPPSVGLALSLVQRLKDVFAGILGLLLWQGFEARGLWELWRERSSPEE